MPPRLARMNRRRADRRIGSFRRPAVNAWTTLHAAFMTLPQPADRHAAGASPPRPPRCRTQRPGPRRQAIGVTKNHQMIRSAGRVVALAPLEVIELALKRSSARRWVGPGGPRVGVIRPSRPVTEIPPMKTPMLQGSRVTRCHPPRRLNRPRVEALAARASMAALPVASGATGGVAVLAAARSNPAGDSAGVVAIRGSNVVGPWLSVPNRLSGGRSRPRRALHPAEDGSSPGPELGPGRRGGGRHPADRRHPGGDRRGHPEAQRLIGRESPISPENPTRLAPEKGNCLGARSSATARRRLGDRVCSRRVWRDWGEGGGEVAIGRCVGVIGFVLPRGWRAGERVWPMPRARGSIRGAIGGPPLGSLLPGQ